MASHNKKTIDQEDVFVFIYSLIENTIRLGKNRVAEARYLYEKYAHLIEEYEHEMIIRRIINAPYGYGNADAKEEWVKIIEKAKQYNDQIDIMKAASTVRSNFN